MHNPSPCSGFLPRALLLPTAMGGVTVTAENEPGKVRGEEELGGACEMCFPARASSCGHTDKTQHLEFCPSGGGV